jgi:endonuclease/exonuclease/phosphatase family metal-dependent hydrolase
MYRKEQRPYHIDYIFQSEDLVSESTIKIGEPNEWLEFSDHMPVICEMP